MKRNPQDLQNELNDFLLSLGQSFSGICIKCIYCDECAFAKTTAVAEMFGWSEVVQFQGARYRGICMDCAAKEKEPANRRNQVNNWIDLGSAPSDEPCAQVGSVDYHPRARRECQAYVRQLRRVFGTEPEGAHVAIHSNPHDFGTYLSVVCHYDPAKPASLDYAFRCENECPANWDEEARRELAQKDGGPL